MSCSPSITTTRTSPAVSSMTMGFDSIGRRRYRPRANACSNAYPGPSRVVIRAMARSIWSGALSFGLVNVPVKLYSAVSRKTVRFHQLNEETGNRIQQKRVDPQTGEEVPYDKLVKGYELTKDRYVVIRPEELDALDPERTRTIDIQDFVDLDEIDPVYYDHPYYLV